MKPAMMETIEMMTAVPMLAEARNAVTVEFFKAQALAAKVMKNAMTATQTTMMDAPYNAPLLNAATGLFDTKLRAMSQLKNATTVTH